MRTLFCLIRSKWTWALWMFRSIRTLQYSTSTAEKLMVKHYGCKAVGLSFRQHFLRHALHGQLQPPFPPSPALFLFAFHLLALNSLASSSMNARCNGSRLCPHRSAQSHDQQGSCTHTHTDSIMTWNACKIMIMPMGWPSLCDILHAFRLHRFTLHILIEFGYYIGLASKPTFPVISVWPPHTHTKCSG